MQPTLLELSLDFLRNAALPVLGIVGYAYLRGVIARWSRPPREIVEGLVCAALAILCMAAPLIIVPGVRLDSRNAVIAIATIFGGPFAGLIAVAGTIAFRLWLAGAGALGGAATAFFAYLVSLALMYGLARVKRQFGYRHLLLLAVVSGFALLIGLIAQPGAVALAMLTQAGVPGLLIVPGSVVVLGGILLLVENGRRAERKLIESEARLRSIIDNLPQPLSIKDRDGRFLLVNRAFERRVQLSPGAAIGRAIGDVWDDLGLGGAAREAGAEIDRAVWRTGEPQATPTALLSVGERRSSVVVTSFPILNPGGKFDAIGTLTNDLTALMRARAQLEERETNLRRQQAMLVEIVREHAAAERPFLDSVRSLTEIAGSVIDATAAVYLIDAEQDVARCVDNWDRESGRHQPGPDIDLAPVAVIAGDLARDRVLAIESASDDIRLAPRFEIMRARRVGALVLCGIYDGAKLAGIFAFIAADPRPWTAEETAFARSIADLLTLMLLMTRHSEALAALDLVRDAIYVARDDGRIIYANRPALELAGGVLPHPDMPLAGDRDLREITMTHDGKPRDLAIQRAKLPAGGVVTVIEDVTEKNAEQRQRDALQLHLRQTSKMEAIGQLAGGIAHDFNNLLGAVMGFARFLEQDLPPETPQHRFAQRILIACNRGKDLVAQILGFTRARAMDKRPVDLRAVLGESRDLLLGSLPATTKLAVEAGDTPLVVDANESQLGQIVVNLCLNAHDAMAGRPGEITVALARVAPGDADYARALLVGRLDPARRYARLDVTDTGSGISAANMPRIFEPFFTTKGRGRGTGLGLAVVHGILTSYEGACGVEGARDGGTRFSVYLPLSDSAVAAPTVKRLQPNPRGRERILIVDDEIDITDMLSIGLERLGYEIAALDDPAEALEVFAEAPAAWDVVITDQLMPGMAGLALAQKLKALRPDIRIILCTGLDDGTLGPAAKAQGIDAFFVKPVEPEQLAAAVRELMRP